ncbi:MAG: hypothetical protein PHR83_02850 [Paludibacter sp.]|nr:hypothetical protein [Paludibacter sp.]
MSILLRTVPVFLCVVGLVFACGKNNEAEIETTNSTRKLVESKVAVISKEYSKSFYSNGNLQNEGWLINTKKSGHWKYYYPNGDWQRGGHYEENLKTGWWEEYLPGKLKSFEGMYKNDQRNGTGIHYHSNGSIAQKGEYLNNKKTEWWEDFDEQGNKLCEGYFKNGMRNGYFRYYLGNGITRDGIYENDQPKGEWKKYKNGKVIQIEMYEQ